MKSKSAFLFSCLFFLFSCNLPTGVFEKHVAIPLQQWHSDFKPEISFTISDTAALYNIFLVLRHSDAYHFNNIWLRVHRSGPDTSYTHQLEIKLANIKDNDSWLGTGMDDIWETRSQINESPVQFRQKGTYTFQLEQIMREDPLARVINVGIRIEKAIPSRP